MFTLSDKKIKKEIGGFPIPVSKFPILVFLQSQKRALFLPAQGKNSAQMREGYFILSDIPAKIVSGLRRSTEYISPDMQNPQSSQTPSTFPGHWGNFVPSTKI